MAPTDQDSVPRGGDVNVFGDQAGFGWLFFSGTVLGLAGLMRIVDAIWAFGYKGSLPDNLQNGVLGDNLKSYGWVWLGVGILLIIASFMLLTRSQFARWIGLLAAAIMTIERDDLDAVLPDLGAHVRRDRPARVLRTDRPRGPRARVIDINRGRRQHHAG